MKEMIKLPKLIDLTGQKFGRLTVLHLDIETTSKQKRWICQCDCGNIKSIQGSNLKSGLTQSCGCLHKEKATNSFIGQRFGKLTVLKDSGKRTNKRGIIWQCQCDCGNICEIAGTNLQQKYTFSCGCLKQSHGELIIENLLKQHNIDYKKEYVFKDLITPKGGNARFDFAILDENKNVKYLIEYDGETHDFSHIHGWNTEEKIKYCQICDNLKNEYCQIHSIPLLRISYKQNNITIDDLLL